MKKIIPLCILFTVICDTISAQESIIEDINQEQLDRLIQLAKDHAPQRKIAELNEAKAKSAVNGQLANYLDLVNVSYFYRPEDRAALGMENPYVVNGFQFGVNLNLGTFFQKPSQTKQAKVNYKIAQLERVAYDQGLESEVKTRYYSYIQSVGELKLKTQTFQDAKALSDDMQMRFEQGEIALEAYSEAKSALSSASSAKLESEVTYLQSKDALEQLVGVKIETVD